jgi:hypothetical protein
MDRLGVCQLCEKGRNLAYMIYVLDVALVDGKKTKNAPKKYTISLIEKCGPDTVRSCAKVYLTHARAK